MQSLCLLDNSECASEVQAKGMNRISCRGGCPIQFSLYWIGHPAGDSGVLCKWKLIALVAFVAQLGISWLVQSARLHQCVLIC
jgi:hypothetical protein